MDRDADPLLPCHWTVLTSVLWRSVVCFQRTGSAQSHRYLHANCAEEQRDRTDNFSSVISPCFFHRKLLLSSLLGRCMKKAHEIRVNVTYPVHAPLFCLLPSVRCLRFSLRFSENVSVRQARCNAVACGALDGVSFGLASFCLYCIINFSVLQ